MIYFLKVNENVFYVYPLNPESLVFDYDKIHKRIGIIKKYQKEQFKYIGSNLNYPLDIQDFELLIDKLKELNNY